MGRTYEIIVFILCISVLVEWIAYLIRDKTQSILYSILISSAIVFVLLYGRSVLGWI